MTAYLSAAVGKTMAPETVQVYFDALQAFDAATLAVAVREVVRHHTYPTLPTPGAVYEAASAVWRRQQEARERKPLPELQRLPPEKIREVLRLSHIGRMPPERGEP